MVKSSNDWKYRKKGDRIVIEYNRKYKATLPRDASITFYALQSLRHSLNITNASGKDTKKEQKEMQMFAQDELSEVSKDDAQILKEAKEAQDRIMGEIYRK